MTPRPTLKAFLLRLLKLIAWGSALGIAFEWWPRLAFMFIAIFVFIQHLEIKFLMKMQSLYLDRAMEMERKRQTILHEATSAFRTALEDAQVREQPYRSDHVS